MVRPQTRATTRHSYLRHSCKNYTGLSKDKHSSLFVLSVSDEANNFMLWHQDVSEDDEDAEGKQDDGPVVLPHDLVEAKTVVVVKVEVLVIMGLR